MVRAKRLSDGTPTEPLPTGVWVDVEAPTPEELARLQERYPLNPLALEDAREKGHWSRFEAYPEHLFLILVLEVHPSAQGNRLNRVVQALTVISVLFLPMSLWAGIYGTNFDTFTEYHWPLGRVYFWGGLALIGGSLAWWMKRRGWW
ncbi:CorA family divalent cation transporter [Thermus islandicus]|uniref:CorA family divalent cation transporter n=1 Tax=Thermus islandicus TaxID=540988 RepID=UPI0004230BA7|nr:CorA family divalent cation transporter [Thermus islandicus]